MLHVLLVELTFIERVFSYLGDTGSVVSFLLIFLMDCSHEGGIWTNIFDRDTNFKIFGRLVKVRNHYCFHMLPLSLSYISVDSRMFILLSTVTVAYLKPTYCEIYSLLSKEYIWLLFIFDQSSILNISTL